MCGVKVYSRPRIDLINEAHVPAGDLPTSPCTGDPYNPAHND
jgi:hypothetical protein